MRLYGVLAVIAVGAAGITSAVRWAKANIISRSATERSSLWVIVASPLIVAVVVVGGMIFLGAENLAGVPFAQQQGAPHSAAIEELFFRH